MKYNQCHICNKFYKWKAPHNDYNKIWGEYIYPICDECGLFQYETIEEIIEEILNEKKSS